MELGFFNLVALPIGLGLLGFIEPCSIGSTLIFTKYLEGKNAASKIAEVAVFVFTRAVLIGLLGLAAAAVGAVFIGFQKAGWVLLGAIYVAIGAFYLTGKAGILMTTIGPGFDRLSGLQGSAGLGILFGLNIPACAAPLLVALLGMAAAGGVSGGALAVGFVSLGLFGLALSLPLVLAVLFEPARRALDWIAGLSKRIPIWTGIVLVALGLWSIGFGLLAEVQA